MLSPSPREDAAKWAYPLFLSQKELFSIIFFTVQQEALSHSRKFCYIAKKSVLRQKLEKSSFCGRNWKKDSLAAEIGENLVRGRNWRKVPSAAETEDRHHVLPAVSVPLANET